MEMVIFQSDCETFLIKNAADRILSKKQIFWKIYASNVFFLWLFWKEKTSQVKHLRYVIYFLSDCAADWLNTELWITNEKRCVNEILNISRKKSSWRDLLCTLPLVSDRIKKTFYGKSSRGETFRLVCLS